MEKTGAQMMAGTSPSIGDVEKASARQAEIMLAAAKTLVITNDTQNANAGDTLLQIKKKAKELTARRQEMTKPLDTAKKSIMDFFRAPLGYLEDAEKLIKKAMGDYVAEQARIQREREAEARRIAQEEEERQRKAAEAEAKKLEKKGDTAAAEQVRQEAASYVAPVVAPVAETKKVKGVHTRTVWKGVCDDFNLLLGAIVRGEAPVDLVTLDQTRLNQIANALKNDMRIAGCRAVEETNIVARG